MRKLLTTESNLKLNCVLIKATTNADFVWDGNEGSVYEALCEERRFSRRHPATEPADCTLLPFLFPGCPWIKQDHRTGKRDGRRKRRWRTGAIKWAWLQGSERSPMNIHEATSILTVWVNMTLARKPMVWQREIQLKQTFTIRSHFGMQMDFLPHSKQNSFKAKIKQLRWIYTNQRYRKGITGPDVLFFQ